MSQLNWTSEKPTKDGPYWLSIKPEHRDAVGKLIHVPSDHALGEVEAVTLFTRADGERVVLLDGWDNSVSDARGGLLLDGALWAERTTPEDPFAKPERMHTDQE